MIVVRHARRGTTTRPHRRDERAVTLELPIVFLVADSRLGLLLEPYVELGLPGGAVDLDERGVQVGATVFF